jgi:hypothetical protein
MATPELYHNGVTAAVNSDTPNNSKSNSYEPRLKITVCFDLEQDHVNNSINSAVSDLEITIRERSIPDWQTLFTTRRVQLLKNDSSGEPLNQFEIKDNVISVLEMAIACGTALIAASSGPAAPLTLVMLSGGLPSAAGIFFKLLKPSYKKQEDISREIKIRYSKWYSFKKWKTKPYILQQDLQLVLDSISNQNTVPSPVEYEVIVSAETGQIAHKNLPVVVRTGEIKVNSEFEINWT